MLSSGVGSDPIWHPGRMLAEVLFAGVATTELHGAMRWYEAVLGRPADITVNADEVMWRISDGGWLYLLQDAARAGQALVTISVADLDQAVADIAARGVDAPPIETIPGAGRKAPFTDPEGNLVALIEVLTTGA